MRIFTIAALAGTAVLTVGASLADPTPPHQKPGLWQSAMVMNGQNISTQSCMDAATEEKMSAFSAQSRQKNCQSSHLSHNIDGSWTSVSTCTFAGKTQTTHITVSGDFNSKIMTVMYDEDASKPEMTATMTWVGPCKAGMRGGDVMMANGMKMNVIDGTNNIQAHAPH